MKKDFPKKENLIKSIENLNNIDFEKVSYNKVCSILLDEIKLLPIHSRTIQPQTSIFRGRFNNATLFTTEQEISYNPKPSSIKTYGRFNIPFQQAFYGSLILHPEEKIENTIFNELQNHTVFSSNNNIKMLTIGRWEAIKEFKIVSTLFEETDINVEKEVSPDNKEEIDLIIEFYSKQIKKSNLDYNHDNYKLTAAYANYVQTQVENCSGIVYHSAENVSMGRNIFLTPNAVDSFLDLKEVKLFLIMSEESSKRKLINLMYTKDLGNYNTSFKWKFNEEYIDLINNLSGQL